MTRRQLMSMFAMIALALALGGWIFAGVPWNVLVSTNTVSSSYSNVATFTSPQGFVKLQGSAGQSSAAGIVLTITNAQGMLSNGVLTIPANVSSQAWSTLLGRPGVTTNQYKVIITPQ